MKTNKDMVVEISKMLIEELKADIKAGTIKDPRLLMMFGGDENVKN